MADFRKMLYAFAGVALLAGLTVPANAQQCTVSSGVNTLVRAEGWTELVGDIKLVCTGGVPALGGAVIPKVQILVSMNSNITSRIVATLNNGNVSMTEALLIIDEPNTTTYNNTGGRPIINCGYAAEDSGPDGPGVCSIKSDGNPADTYDGSQNVIGTAAGTPAAPAQVACNGGANPAAGTYGCGRPNVFQGRQASSLISGQPNVVQFLGIPYDSPAAGQTRTLRITNLRVDATRYGVASPFSTVPVIATIAISGDTSIALSNTSIQVGQVQQGLLSKNSPFTYLQCVATATSTGASNNPFYSGSGLPGSASPTGGQNIRVQENFPTAFKVRNLRQILDNGTFNQGDYRYVSGSTVWTDLSGDNDQNVPGAIYNTESGFFNNGTTTNPNPPQGFGNGTVTNVGQHFHNGGSTPTGFDNSNGSKVGQANQGTRIALTMDAPLAGTQVFLPIVVNLKNLATGGVTGVMVLTSTNNDGSGGFVQASPATLASPVLPGNNALWSPQPSNNVAVYEVLFSSASAVEYADIIPALVYDTKQLSTNLAAPGTVNASVSFAPFSSNASWGLPSQSLPIPRFIPSGAATAIYTISKCVCDLLFPWVVGDSSVGYLTSIVVANTSLDPGSPFGFGASPSFGAVTFWYFGTKGVSLDPSVLFSPATTLVSQTSTVTVPAGSYLAHIVTNGAAGNTAANGLKALTGPFAGYVIAQAQFQYCHGVASISGGGLATQTYIGLQLDKGGLSRTNQVSEVLAH